MFSSNMTSKQFEAKYVRAKQLTISKKMWIMFAWLQKRSVEQNNVEVWISLQAGMELSQGQFEVALRQTI